MIKLEINPRIYSLKNVEIVLNLYKELADIKQVVTLDKIILTFNDCRLDEKLTVREFENYLIGLENTNAIN